MMRYLSILILLVAMAAASTSCNQKIKNERLARIDSLGIHLNHVREVVESVDSTMMENRIAEIGRTSSWVFDNVTDTLDRIPGLAIGDFFRARKFFGKALDRFRNVKKELHYSEKQLVHLRTDVTKNFYSEEEFDGYFSTEAQAIKRLTEAADELQANYESVNAQYQRVKPVVTHTIDSIKSVIYGSEPLVQ